MKKADPFLAAMGAKIKRLREQRGIPIEELARKSHINPERFKGIEAGKRDFRLDELEYIAEALDVRPCHLVDDELP